MGDSMRRRDFITILGGAAATQVTSATLLRAASAKRPIIGIPFLWPSTKAGALFYRYFLKGLQDRGTSWTATSTYNFA
jgi:hypothetical protein